MLAETKEHIMKTDLKGFGNILHLFSQFFLLLSSCMKKKIDMRAGQKKYKIKSDTKNKKQKYQYQIIHPSSLMSSLQTSGISDWNKWDIIGQHDYICNITQLDYDERMKNFNFLLIFYLCGSQLYVSNRELMYMNRR